MEVQCLDEERHALLGFKHGVQADHCDLLSSWGGSPDCCQWGGIRCDNDTGNVVMVRLPGLPSVGRCLEGTLSVSITGLKHLKYLDLSYNDFQGQTIPKFIGLLSNLEQLNLSNALFGGVVLHEIGNLSRLSSLDLNCLDMNDCLMSVDSTWRLSRLKLLRDVNLGSVDLSLVPDWVSIIDSLPLLEVLRMDFCSLLPELPSSSLSYINSSNTLRVVSLSMNNLEGTSVVRRLHNLNRIESSLEYLDLSSNRLSEGILPFLWNINSLSHLDLSVNGLRGQIPSDLGKMHRLSFLSLDENSLSGHIPNEIWDLENLSYLNMAGNHLEGPISNSISNLKRLTILDLSENKLYFSKHALRSLGELCMLQTLVFDGINLTYAFSQVIEPLSSCVSKSLVSLGLSDNRLNGTVSERIGKLSKLEDLDLSDNQLNGVVSDKHFSNLSRLSSLNLNDNRGLVVNLGTSWTPPFQLGNLLLRSCKVGPNFPKWLITQQKLVNLDISNVGIRDTVPKSFWTSSISTLQSLNMSNNMIHGVLSDLSITFRQSVSIDMSSNDLIGAVPFFLGYSASDLNLKNNKLSRGLYRFLCPKTEMDLMFLDLSNNLLSEIFPDCWSYIPYLTVLKLQNNNIRGKLSPSFAVLYSLQ
ncbi:hypothetical protein vseg_011942 [Gypsophila vaccaria]